MFTVREAAEYLSVTRMAIHMAIKKKRIAVERDGHLYKIKKEDVDRYMLTKYQRSETARKDGEKIYRLEDGLVPVPFIARLLEIDAQDLYNGKNMGYFAPVNQSGKQLVFRLEDLLQYALLRGLTSEEKASEVRNYCLSLINVPKNQLIKTA